MAGRVGSWFRVRFISGFFVTVPTIATSWLLWVFWNSIDQFFSPGYERFFGRQIPGLGFLTAIVLILLVGIIATNVVGRRVVTLVESLMLRIPVFRSIYPSVKQLLEAFSPERRSSFKEVVLAEHPRKGEYVFGFLTGEVSVEGPEGVRQMVTVFIPTNNLYLGEVILLQKNEVVYTGLTVEEGLRILLSAGTAVPGRLPRERR